LGHFYINNKWQTEWDLYTIYLYNKLHEISPNVGRSFYQISVQWDQIVYIRCKIGNSRMNF